MSVKADMKLAERLRMILQEMKEQTHLSEYFGGESLSFQEEMDQLYEYVEYAGEYGIAYESIVSCLECVPFMLSGKASICLLEVGLLLRYKTDMPEDLIYDYRKT